LLKKERSEAKNNQTFFEKNKKNFKATFRYRANLHHKKQCGGPAIFDRDAALERQDVILQIMSEYSPDKIFNFDES